MTPPVTVLIVDDHAIIRNGLTNLLGQKPDIKVVGDAANGQEGFEKALKTKPDVVVMDIYMPVCNGLEAMINIKENLPGTKVLFFSISENEQDLFQALRFGAEGYILKSADINEIADAIQRTANGETILSSKVAKRLVEEFRHKAAESPLSDREKEVFQLVGEGFTNSGIAQRLFISEATVRTYLNRLLNKLHLKNRTEAIAYAQRHLGRHVP
jgi:DNA-binding NarL/FixJ family response regulator